MVEVSTSILSVKEQDAIKTFYELEVAKTDYFHIDVMDGKFVEKNTKTQMLEYSNILKQITNLPLDVHLMVENVKEYVEEYISLEPNIITFHLESVNSKEEMLDLINFIKQNHIKVGISIKPNTPVSKIINYLPYIHLVLIMTVEPGLGGQKLIKETIEKVKEVKTYIDENNLEVDIQVDGGIKKDNVEILKNVGANIIVAGTGVINSEDYKEAIKELKK